MKSDDYQDPDVELTGAIIGAAIEVHRQLGGPGLLESVYEEALCIELALRGLQVSRQVNLPIHYKGIRLKDPLRMDILVERKVIIECKAVSAYNDIFENQALTYLRQTGLRLALVINFGARAVKDGVHRVINEPIE